MAPQFKKAEVEEFQIEVASMAKKMVDDAIHVARILSYSPDQRDITFKMYKGGIMEDLMDDLMKYYSFIHLVPNEHGLRDRRLQTMEQLGKNLLRAVSIQKERAARHGLPVKEESDD